MLQKTVKKFTDQEINPIAVNMDQQGRLPDDLIGKIANLGLLGMTLPKKYGGSDAGNIDVILAIEQLACSGTPAWWLVGFGNSIPASINHFGSEEIKQKCLPLFCSGKAYPSIQFTEEEQGSDPKALITTSKPDGKYYVINGMKRFSTFGGRNGYAVLYTKDETSACTAFVIEKNKNGYNAQKTWDLMGSGGIESSDVYFDDMKVPAGNLLGEKGKGFDILLYWIALEKVEQCAASIGIAQAALDEAVAYTKTRKSKGKPVSDMQGIRWMLADMHASLEAARWLTYRAAFLQDTGDSEWQTAAATAKLFVVPATIDVVEKARRLHGGYGYAKEFKIERLCRAIYGATGIATTLEMNRSIVGGWLTKK